MIIVRYADDLVAGFEHGLGGLLEPVAALGGPSYFS